MEATPFEVKLTAAELLLLDGKCSPAVQAVVERARAARALEADGVDSVIAAFVTAIVNEARQNGKLVFKGLGMQYCSLCKQSAGYWPHTRSGRYHRKGQPDTRRPKSFGGWEFAERFVVMTGYASLGACDACVNKALPSLRTLLADVKAELPEGIMGHPKRYKKYDLRKCKDCGWEGHEAEMLPGHTMMGDGLFFAYCPKCKAENHLFVTRVESVKGHAIVDVRPKTLEFLKKMQADAHEEKLHFWSGDGYAREILLYLGHGALEKEQTALRGLARKEGDAVEHRRIIDQAVEAARADQPTTEEEKAA